MKHTQVKEYTAYSENSKLSFPRQRGEMGEGCKMRLLNKTETASHKAKTKKFMCCFRRWETLLGC